ncbi:MAG: M23 family metallopeptidase [Persicimonas sp.]
MARRFSTNDLLGSQRRRARRRARKIRIAAAVFFVAAVGVAWWWYVRGDEENERARADTERAAVTQASAAVSESISAGRRPLEVEERDEDELGTSNRDEQLTARWSEGEAVTLRGVLEDHQSVFASLEERGLSAQVIHRVIEATDEEFDFRRSRPGHEWVAEVDEDGVIERFQYQKSPEDVWETTLTEDDTYECEKVDVPVEVRKEVVAGEIDESLWKTLLAMGEEGRLVYGFADIFAYAVDFNSGTRPGDRFALVFEKVYLNDEFVRYGRILAAYYAGEEGVHYGFYHAGDDEDEEGGGYYDEDGDNLQRQFLKSPLASVRVTSQFGKRYHPVSGEMKMHNGVDYGAPIGTPVRAVADGTVTYAGWKGPNGRLVTIKHARGYVTHYAHLSSIADGIQPGARIDKKTIIGEVGNSGRSTGPHLHFGMKRHGRYVNPRKIDAERAEPLRGGERERFREEVVEPLKERLDEALEDDDLLTSATDSSD